MPLKKSVRVTKQGVKNRIVKSSKSKIKKKRSIKLASYRKKNKSSSKSTRSKRSNNSSQSFFEERFKDKRTWMFIAFAIIAAFFLQQFNVVSLVVQDDVLPQCSKHEHCQLGKHCIFDRCYAHTPAYPEIGKVKVFTAYGKEVIPNNQGRFEVEADELMYLEVQADNEKNPFQIHVYSHVGFGQRGLTKNRNAYAELIAETDAEHKNLYWVEVEREEKDNYHRFYFELLGFRGEEYNMFVFLKNASDYIQSSSEIIELPIKVV